jgi:hypothetical protein
MSPSCNKYFHCAYEQLVFISVHPPVIHNRQLWDRRSLHFCTWIQRDTLDGTGFAWP